MEITNEIRAKIFALYYGCEAIHGSFPKSTFIIKGVYHDRPYLGTSDSDTSYKCNADNCKLLLKPLSSISDEDAIEIAKIGSIEMTYPNVGYGKSIVIGRQLSHNLHNGHNVLNASFVIDYLRYKGYMLPAYGITDLFEAGIATPSTITDKNK